MAYSRPIRTCGANASVLQDASRNDTSSLGSRATALLRSFGLLREPIQRALLAAALRQLSARRRGSCASTAVFADMRSSVACHGHEMADNKKNMTPE